MRIRTAAGISLYLVGIAVRDSYSFPVNDLMSSSTTGATARGSDPSSVASAAAAEEARSLHLFRRTPMIHSAPLSRRLGKPVYLKLDALQASGSYKDRGVAHSCLELRKRGVSRLISSSGGNAGLAVATVGPRLGLSVHVVVPQTTKPLVIDKLRALGAEVSVHGENWNQADVLARQMVENASAQGAAYVSPYDNPLLWTGVSTWIDEVVDDLASEQGMDAPPGAVILGVGGGGLLCGTLEGLARHGLRQTTVIAAETEGAASFGRSFQQGKLVRLEAITSIATSLGALEVTPVALERAQQHQAHGGIVRESICTDAQAVNACWEFAKDHRLLVEPACGAALAVVYSEELRDRLLADVKGPIVVEVCGGNGVDVTLLQQWSDQFTQSE